MVEETYWLSNQWDNCIVTVIDGVVTHVNILYLFSEQAHCIPNITRLSKEDGKFERIQFQKNETLRPLIKQHEWLPWDIFKEEVARIGWVNWYKQEEKLPEIDFKYVPGDPYW